MIEFNSEIKKQKLLNKKAKSVSLKSQLKGDKKRLAAKKKKKIFIGVAWPYANDNLHIGHLVGCYLGADIFARFHRLIGHQVLMVSGTDYHGTPVSLKAFQTKTSPHQVAKKYHLNHKNCLSKAEISFDIYTATNTNNHRVIVQKFFCQLLKQGYLFKKKSQQFFSETEKMFLPDTYVEGICPHCQAKQAKSNQCDQCGAIDLGPQLKNPTNKISQQPLILKETEHYFLDWPKLQNFLEKYIAQTSPQWRNWIRKETETWLKKGLKPRAITRDIEYGIKLPVKDIPPAKRLARINQKRIYVWFEAVIGYLSASIEWAEKHQGHWQDFWYTKEVKQYYFMGKDNLVFHTLFWPGQLFIYDQKIHLPDINIINYFLMHKGNKLSKSRGQLIEAEALIDQYGSDIVRFYLTSIMPENNDSNFSWSDLKEKTNNVLIGNFGNFIHRTLSLTQSKASCPLFLARKRLAQLSINPDIQSMTLIHFKSAKHYLTEVKLKKYLETVQSLSAEGNKYLEQKEPWREKNKNDNHFLETIFNTLYLLIGVVLLLKPLLPSATAKIEKMINLKLDQWPTTKTLDSLIKKNIQAMIIPEQKLEPLFQKIKD